MAWTITTVCRRFRKGVGYQGCLFLTVAQNKKGEKWQHSKALYNSLQAEAFAEKVRVAQRKDWAGPKYPHWRKWYSEEERAEYKRKQRLTYENS